MSCYLLFFVLFELGFIMFKNCVLMGLMYIGLEELLDGVQWLVVFYVECVCYGVVLIVIGGIVLVFFGVIMVGGVVFNDVSYLVYYCYIIDVVYQEGGKIVLQILYIGCYSYQFVLVVFLVLQVLINCFIFYELSYDEILMLIDDFVYCVQLVCEVGYDGVEVMGFEGYLINEFFVVCINQCDD